MRLLVLCIISLLHSFNAKPDVKSSIPCSIRKLMSFSTVALSSLSFISPAMSTVEPTITARVVMDVSINRRVPESIKIGMFGNESPTGSKIFVSVCKGEYSDGLSYDSSQVSRVRKDQRIDVNKFALGSAQKSETWMDSVGKVRIRNRDLAEQVINSDANELRHNSAGIVSVPKGGKSFGFTIAPKANEELDESNVVIGRVIEGLDVVEKINNVPVSREDILGTKQGFANAGKGFDGRAKLASVERPLVKVQIVQCRVEESAAIASFLKY